MYRIGIIYKCGEQFVLSSDFNRNFIYMLPYMLIILRFFNVQWTLSLATHL